MISWKQQIVRLHYASLIHIFEISTEMLETYQKCQETRLSTVLICTYEKKYMFHKKKKNLVPANLPTRLQALDY
jgi:hypothetical protein